MGELWTPDTARAVRGSRPPVVVFDLGERSPIGPYRVDSEDVLPGKLVLGSWLLCPYELQSEDGETEVFVERLRDACKAKDVWLMESSQTSQSITVVWGMGQGTAALPDDRQLVASVEALNYYRRTDKRIADEVAVKSAIGRGQPTP